MNMPKHRSRCRWAATTQSQTTTMLYMYTESDVMPFQDTLVKGVFWHYRFTTRKTTPYDSGTTPASRAGNATSPRPQRSLRLRACSPERNPQLHMTNNRPRVAIHVVWRRLEISTTIPTFASRWRPSLLMTRIYASLNLLTLPMRYRPGASVAAKAIGDFPLPQAINCDNGRSSHSIEESASSMKNWEPE
jgi:hypothetical protein